MHANGQNAITIEYLYSYFIFYKYKKLCCTTELNVMHVFFKYTYFRLLHQLFIKFNEAAFITLLCPDAYLLLFH